MSEDIIADNHRWGGSPGVRASITGTIVGVILGAFFLVTCRAKDIAWSIGSPHWFLNGVPAPRSVSLDVMTDSLLPDLCGADYGYYTRGEQVSWRIDTVGSWQGRVVVDIFGEIRAPGWPDSTTTYTHRMAKAIAVETTCGRYRLMYLSWSEPWNISFVSSVLTDVKGISVLYTCARMSGTGNFYDDAYWTWDDTDKAPRRLNYTRAVGVAIGEVLPPHHGVWKGGRFSIDSLRYRSYTWRDGDGNCCPTGGSVRADFEIDGGKLVVRRATFDYGDLEARALWTARRSSDSMYTKQPPRIFEGEDALDAAGTPHWLCLGGMYRGFGPAPYATSLDSLVNRQVRNAISGSIYTNSKTTPFLWSVDTVGVINGTTIVEIAYSFNCPSCRDTTGRAIAAEVEPSRYRLMYIEMTISGQSTVGQSFIFTVGEHKVLAVKGHTTFDGNSADTWWVWFPNSSIPGCLHHQWVLNETLHHLLWESSPGGHTVSIERGAWSFDDLTYRTVVWRKANSDDGLAGHRLSIQFGIKNRRLLPISVTFDPSYK